MAQNRQNRGKSLPATLGLITLACASILPISASAQGTSQERVYVDLGIWTIYSVGDSRTCTLRHSGSQRASLVMTKTGTAASSLRLELANRNIFVGNVVFAFDEDEFPARLSGGRFYTPDASSTEIESAFRQARILTLNQGGATLASIPLNASSAGFRLLKQCAEQGRLGMARAPAPPPPAPEPLPSPSPVPRAATELTPPAAPAPSLARPPVPRNPQDWVRERDYRVVIDGPYDGTVRFTLIVNRRGRAEECIVEENTGPSNLGEIACRALVRRARFEPARDANGVATEGRYSSSVRLQYSD